MIYIYILFFYYVCLTLLVFSLVVFSNSLRARRRRLSKFKVHVNFAHVDWNPQIIYIHFLNFEVVDLYGVLPW